MSYFSADERMEAGTAPVQQPEAPRVSGEPGALFAADERLEAGTAVVPAARPAQDKPQIQPSSLFAADERLESGAGSTPAPVAAEAVACPACGAALEPGDGWLACPACAARYVEAGGALAAENALPYGACACCRPRQPLVLEHGRPLCPLSGRPHALCAGGHAELADEPAGPPAGEPSLPGLDEIDAALAANSALLAIHGIFIHPQ